MNDALIKEARVEVKNDPKGRLSLPNRKKLWAEFKIQYNPDTGFAYKTKGLVKRYTLALSCVLKISNLWSTYNVEAGNILKDLLKNIDKCLHGLISAEQLSDMCSKAYNFLQDVDSSVIDYMALCYAVLELSDLMKFGESSAEDEDITDDDTQDDELDLGGWDTSYLISLSYTYSQEPNEQKRIENTREYWLWYIDKFVEIYNSNEFEDLETVK